MISQKLESALKTIYRYRAVGQPLEGMTVVALADVLTDALEGVRELERALVPLVPDNGAVDIDEVTALARLYLAGQRKLTTEQTRSLAAALLSQFAEEVGRACA